METRTTRQEMMEVAQDVLGYTEKQLEKMGIAKIEAAFAAEGFNASDLRTTLVGMGYTEAALKDLHVAALTDMWVNELASRVAAIEIEPAKKRARRRAPVEPTQRVYRKYDESPAVTVRALIEAHEYTKGDLIAKALEMTGAKPTYIRTMVNRSVNAKHQFFKELAAVDSDGRLYFPRAANA